MKPLFDLPEYDDSFDRFVHRAINELIHRKDPILREIPARFSDEINTTQNTMPSGEVVENKPFGFRMPFGVEFDEVIEGQSAKLLKAINDAAEEGLKVLMPQFFDQLTRVSTAAGTAVDAQGVPLSWALILQSWEKIGSYARQNSVHKALAEIGRVHKTVHILRTLNDEKYRRRMGRELNKGEAAHDLSRFLCFGKEGVLRGREFGDQVHTFSCLSVLHNAVVGWNILHIEPIVNQLHAEGKNCSDHILSLTTPLMRKHLNPFGKYHFDLNRMRRLSGEIP